LNDEDRLFLHLFSDEGLVVKTDVLSYDGGALREAIASPQEGRNIGCWGLGLNRELLYKVDFEW
jgi:hypothetical protein